LSQLCVKGDHEHNHTIIADVAAPEAPVRLELFEPGLRTLTAEQGNASSAVEGVLAAPDEAQRYVFRCHTCRSAPVHQRDWKPHEDRMSGAN
jgi:hypothetical protein